MPRRRGTRGTRGLLAHAGWWWLLLARADTNSALWPCAGDCFALPDAMPTTLYTDFDCPHCNCSQSTYVDPLVTDSVQCVPCATAVLAAWAALNKVPPLTNFYTPDCGAASTAGALWECAEGYYQRADAVACAQCLPGLPVCGTGLYPARCQLPTANGSVCAPCDSPALNADGSQTYGAAVVLPSCASVANPALTLCVWHQTPPWDERRCAVDCAPGYVNRDISIAPSDFTDVPTCVPCASVPQFCPPGTYCPGGRAPLNCLPCGAQGIALPGNASWSATTACAWTCDGAYFLAAGGAACAPCEARPCTGPAAAYEVFVGCGGGAPGACVQFLGALTCTAPLQRVDASPTAPGLRCANCTAPTPGLTYQALPCLAQTPTVDAVVLPCTAACGAGRFMARNCSATEDAACANCSAPAGPGLLRLRACGAFSDAAYGPCPANLSCDGGPAAAACPAPQHAAAGVCVCPPAYVLAAGACAVMACPAGGYPDPATGACQPCSSGPHAVAAPGVLGLAACACAPGYFVQRLADGTVRCWPCGDLLCTPGVQLQTPCPGDGAEEPACACSPPPGAEAADNVTCAAACAPGYAAGGPPGAPAVYGARATLVQQAGGWAAVALPAGAAVTSAAVLAADAVLFVVDWQAMYVARELAGAWATAPLSEELLLQGDYRAGSAMVQVTVTAATCASAYCAWVGFVYAGGCTPAYVKAPLCFTMELVTLVPADSNAAQLAFQCLAAVGLCAQLLTSSDGSFDVWGRDLPYGVVGSAAAPRNPYAMALSPAASGQQQTMYFAMGANGTGAATQLLAYAVAFYAPGAAARPADLPLAPVAQGLCGVRSLAFAMQTLYAADCAGRVFAAAAPAAYGGASAYAPAAPPLPPGGAAAVYTLAPGLLGFVAADGTGGQADLWNLYYARQAAPGGLLLAAYASSLWFAANGSHALLSASATPCGVDALAYAASAEHAAAACAPAPCLRVASCGPNTTRAVGASVCACVPGFLGSPPSTACAPCPAGSYCAGGPAATPCPSDSSSLAGAATAQQCLCDPGFYAFRDAGCLPCPTGSWCLGNYTPPVPCASGGATAGPGSRSPLQCTCPARTYGLACLPCSAAQTCRAQASVAAVAAVVTGSGPVSFTDASFGRCAAAGSAAAVHYTVPSLAPPLNDSALLAPDGLLQWGWVLVAQAPSLAPVQAAVAACVRQEGLAVDGFSLLVAGATHVYTPAACGDTWEWSGLPDASPDCVCQAGYQQATLKSGGYEVCVPCGNGTVRPARSLALRCGACNDSNAYAPWLAMAACVCRPGYYADLGTGLCQPRLLGVWALYAQLASPLVAIPVAGVAGVAAVLVAVLCAG